MQATPTERKLFKEAVIREYQLKKEAQNKKKRAYSNFLGKLRRIVPLNIAVGLIASFIFAYINGWTMLGHLFLSGIIWITLIATLVSVFLGSK